jgi:ribosomal protein S21
MKRTNVVLDEELLETARRVTGERTYSGAITKALKAIVKQDELEHALEEFQREAAKGGFFTPGYLEEIRPRAYTTIGDRRERISADEKRVPRKAGIRRGAR